MNRVYSQSLAAFLKRRWIALPFTIVTILLIGVLWNTIPAEWRHWRTVRKSVSIQWVPKE